MRFGISEIETCTPLSFMITVLDSNTTMCSRLSILREEIDRESEEKGLLGEAIGGNKMSGLIGIPHCFQFWWDKMSIFD